VFFFLVGLRAPLDAAMLSEKPSMLLVAGAAAGHCDLVIAGQE